MPELKKYRLFVSHGWTYSDEYARFINLLDAAPYFDYANYSVPKQDPLKPRTRAALKDAL